MILQKMAVHVASNIKSLSLKQQFYLPGLIPSTKSTSEILNHVQGFPFGFSRTCFQFHYHSINDSHDTISCVKCLVKAWLKKLRASTWKRYFYSYFTMKWTVPYIFVVCATKSLKDLNNCGRSLAASSNFKKRVK